MDLILKIGIKMDTVVIAEFNDNVLYISDIFCEREVELDDIIASMVNREIKKVVLGFTPEKTESFDEILLREEGTTLFILDDKWGLFGNKK